MSLNLALPYSYIRDEVKMALMSIYGCAHDISFHFALTPFLASYRLPSLSATFLRPEPYRNKGHRTCRSKITAVKIMVG